MLISSFDCIIFAWPGLKTSKMSNCSTHLSEGIVKQLAYLGIATGGASVVVCSLAIILLLLLRLYKMLSYRLALYQGLSSLLFGMSTVGYFLAFGAPHPICQAVGFFGQLLIMMKVLFVVCLTFHLFCFAVFHKNLKRLEVAYVSFSVCIPLLMAVIPFTTNSYGQAGAWCWIQNWKNNCPLDIAINGEIEQFVLLYGVAFIILVVVAIAVVVMLTVLIYRVYCRHDKLAMGSNHHRRALKHLLPLIVYPIVFCVFFLIPFANRLYMSEDKLELNLIYASAFFIPAWSFAAGTALLMHMLIVLISTIKKRWTRPLNGIKRVVENYGSSQNATTVHKTDTGTCNSDTHFVLPSTL